MMDRREASRQARGARPRTSPMDRAKLAECAAVLATIALLLAATAVVLALARMMGRFDPWAAVSSLVSRP